MNPDVLRAPPRKTLVLRFGGLAVLALALAVAAKLWLLPFVQDYLQSASGRDDAIHRVQIVLDWFGALLFPVVGYAAWLAYRTLTTGQWPLPGALVIRDTPVQRGRKAHVRGLAFAVLAILLGTMAILIILLPDFLFRK